MSEQTSESLLDKHITQLRDVAEIMASAAHTQDTMNGAFAAGGDVIAKLMRTRGAALQQAIFDARGALVIYHARLAFSDPLDAIKMEIATTGMTDTQKAVRGFSQLEGVTSDQVKEYAGLATKLDELRKKQDFTEQLKEWREGLKGPLEEYDEAIRRLQELRRQGAITADEASKGIDQAKDELEKAAPKQQLRSDPKFASLIGAGTADAVRLQFSLQRDEQKDEIPKRHLKTAEEQRKLLAKIEQRLNFRVV